MECLWAVKMHSIAKFSRSYIFTYVQSGEVPVEQLARAQNKRHNSSIVSLHTVSLNGIVLQITNTNICSVNNDSLILTAEFYAFPSLIHV